MIEVCTEFKITLSSSFSSEREEEMIAGIKLIKTTLQDAFTMSDEELDSIKITFKEM